MILARAAGNRRRREKEYEMESEQKERVIKVENGGIMGAVWFIGWLFTIAFAKLGLMQILLGLVIWPYYLGVALR